MLISARAVPDVLAGIVLELVGPRSTAPAESRSVHSMVDCAPATIWWMRILNLLASSLVRGAGAVVVVFVSGAWRGAKGTKSEFVKASRFNKELCSEEPVSKVAALLAASRLEVAMNESVFMLEPVQDCVIKGQSKKRK